MTKLDELWTYAARQENTLRLCSPSKVLKLAKEAIDEIGETMMPKPLDSQGTPISLGDSVECMGEHVTVVEMSVQENRSALLVASEPASAHSNFAWVDSKRMKKVDPSPTMADMLWEARFQHGSGIFD